ncbi:hypothetical protein PF001_g32056 [Phytophthora fragariae]|uniref:Uncharacterized protein n=1 Tax=Phytophthora fragariae TaxID=53985 RepID=A0A6A4AVP6_9STRA|nr:hypothetical protein PF001_g32056 [Phytophthora fragariae]
MADPIFLRGEQLEAVVDRLPDWYFTATQVLQQSPIQSDALGLSSSFYAALGTDLLGLRGPAQPAHGDHRQAYYRSKALSRLARGVAPVPADARTQEDKLERAITAFALLPTLRQRF